MAPIERLNHMADRIRALVGRRILHRGFGAAVAVLWLGVSGLGLRAQTGGPHWVGTWATAVVSRPQALLPPAPASAGAPPAGPAAPAGQAAFENQTLRQVVHVSVGGSRVRVVFSNAFGAAPLTIGAAHAARRASGAAIAAGTGHRLTFDGKAGVTIPAGASAVSDAADLQVPALSDLVVDVFLPSETARTMPLTSHNGAWQTNYVSDAGNHVGAAALPVAATVPSWFFLARVEVLAPSAAGAVVAFGDSITDGTRSTNDTNSHWPDFLAKRLQAGGRPMGVLNLGIGGNRLLGDAIPTPAYNAGIGALARFDRDVLAQTGATHVVVLEGINDIRGFAGPGTPRQSLPTADEMIASYRQMVARAHAHGLKIYGATLTPYGGSNGWAAEDDAKRQAVNRWIRTGNAFDGVIDFDAAVRDPGDPTKLQIAFDSTDHLHPSDAGYEAMARAIDLTLFAR
jgi:lysophospholipase L1-like esterase